MALSEIDVRRNFAVALLIVRDRQKRFYESVPKHVWSQDISLRIREMVSALEKQDTPPYNMEKCFLADIAVMATRVLEAYCLDDSGP